MPDGASRQLAAGAQPWVSPDGTRVAYIHDDGNGQSVTAVMPFDGGAAQRLCADCGIPAGWSPDGTALLSANYGTKKTSIFVMSLTSAAPVEYLSHPRHNLYPRGFSPDGHWILFAEDLGGGAGTRTWIAPYQRDQAPPENQWIEIPEWHEGLPRWGLTGDLLYFISIRDGFRCLWAQALDPRTRRPEGKPFSISHFHQIAQHINVADASLAVARDRLVLGLDAVAGNIWIWTPAK